MLNIFTDLINKYWVGCGGCISDGGGNVVGPCAQIWVQVKEPQVVVISGALHYGVSQNHMVVSER